MTPQERGHQLLAQLQAGTLQPAFVEGADVGYLILALLERIQRLEEAQNWPEARGVGNLRNP